MPMTKQTLDKAFSFSVGAWGVGPGSKLLETKDAAVIG